MLVLLTMAQGSTRFEHLEKSINDYIIKQQNKNTRAKTTRDLKLLIEFLREKHEQRNPQEIEAKELNEYLCEFILSVKQKDGKDFKPSSLRGLFSRFNRHLKECEYPVSVIEDVGFERTRICLEAKNKQLIKEGKGNRPSGFTAVGEGRREKTVPYPFSRFDTHPRNAKSSARSRRSYGKIGHCEHNLGVIKLCPCNYCLYIILRIYLL